MKKTILSAIIIAGLTASVYGQGTVLANNQNNTGTYNGNGGQAFNPGTEVGSPTYSSLVTSNGLFFTLDTAAQAGHNGYTAGSQMMGADFSFALFGGATALTATNPVTSLTGGAIAGDNGNWGQLIVSGSQTVPNTSAASLLYLNIFVWEGSTFLSYAAALTGGDYTGTSGAFLNPSGGGPTPASTLSGMPDVLFAPVPEPSTLALAGLGGLASLMAIRRKNS